MLTGSSFKEWQDRSGRGGSANGGNALNGAAKDPDMCAQTCHARIARLPYQSTWQSSIGSHYQAVFH